MEETVKDDTATEDTDTDEDVKRILIADDDSEMRRLLAAVLAGDGYSVEEAGDGDELRARLKSLAGPLDLLVTDVQMPGWTGLQALEWAKRNIPGVEVILITAFGDRDLHARAAALGARAVLDKPFDLLTLKKVVASLPASATTSQAVE